MNSTAYANRAISPFRRFNSQRIELFHIPAGRYKCSGRSFNSQRDGILQKEKNRRRTAASFNSQQDRILLRLFANTAKNMYVTILNGMEFYTEAEYRKNWWAYVSIPNGMEFYPRGRFIVWAKTSFNSQWDGIILKQATINAGFAICFNSQRIDYPPNLY